MILVRLQLIQQQVSQPRPKQPQQQVSEPQPHQQASELQLPHQQAVELQLPQQPPSRLMLKLQVALPEAFLARVSPLRPQLQLVFVALPGGHAQLLQLPISRPLLFVVLAFPSLLVPLLLYVEPPVALVRATIFELPLLQLFVQLLISLAPIAVSELQLQQLFVRLLISLTPIAVFGLQLRQLFVRLLSARVLVSLFLLPLQLVLKQQDVLLQVSIFQLQPLLPVFTLLVSPVRASTSWPLPQQLVSGPQVFIAPVSPFQLSLELPAFQPRASLAPVPTFWPQPLRLVFQLQCGQVALAPVSVFLPLEQLSLPTLGGFFLVPDVVSQRQLRQHAWLLPNGSFQPLEKEHELVAVQALEEQLGWAFRLVLLVRQLHHL